MITISHSQEKAPLTLLAIYLAVTVGVIPLALYSFIWANLSSVAQAPPINDTSYIEAVFIVLTALWILLTRLTKLPFLRSYVEVLLFTFIAICIYGLLIQVVSIPFAPDALYFPVVYFLALILPSIGFIIARFLLNKWSRAQALLTKLREGLFSDEKIRWFLLQYATIFVIGLAFGSVIGIIIGIVPHFLHGVAPFTADATLLLVQLIPVCFSPLIYLVLRVYSLRRPSLTTNLNLISVVVTEAYFYVLLLIFPVYSFCLYVFPTSTRLVVNFGILGMLIVLLLGIGLSSYFHPDAYLGIEGHKKSRELWKRANLFSLGAYRLKNIDREMAELYIRQYISCLAYIFIANAVVISILNTWSQGAALDLLLILVVGVCIYFRVVWVAFLFLPYFAIDHFLSGLQLGLSLWDLVKNPILFIFLFAWMLRGALGALRLHQLPKKLGTESPVYTSDMEETSQHTPSMAIANLFKRALAAVIDVVVLGAVGFLLGLIFSNTFFMLGDSGWWIGAIIAFIYFSILQSKVGKGATLGYRALGLAVVGTDNVYLDIKRVLIRNVLFLLAYFGENLIPPLPQAPVLAMIIGILFLSYAAVIVVFILFHPLRRGLHDLISGSIVVNKKEYERLTDEEKVAFTTQRINLKWPAVVSIICIVLIIIGNIWLYVDVKNKPSFSGLTALEQTLNEIPGVTVTSVTNETVYGATPAKVLNVQVTVDRADFVSQDKLNALGIKIETDVVNSYPQIKQVDYVNVTMTSGYEIGIWSWQENLNDSNSVSDLLQGKSDLASTTPSQ